MATGKRKRIAFVIAHLGRGGAQRVAVNAAGALLGRGFEVHIVVINNRPDAYQMDPRVIIQSRSEARERGQGTGLFQNYVEPYLPAPLFQLLLRILSRIMAVFSFTRRALWLRARIRSIEPDAVLSFLTQTNILTVLATRGLNVHIVVSERNDPRLQRYCPRVEFLRSVVYRWADLVTANSRGALDALQSFVPKEKLAFLPNPLAPASSSEIFAFIGPTVITVGRLVEQKGIDVLLAAWAKVVSVLPDWRLALVGDGPLGDELKSQASKLGIADSIDWIGHVSDPFPYLRGAKLFVMTSRFEGTPNALLEAMACGLPAVVSDASPGPCEMIGSGDDTAGLIVPVEDASAMADAVIRLAHDETLRRRLGLAARERARAHNADRAIDVWLKLLACE